PSNGSGGIKESCCRCYCQKSPSESLDNEIIPFHPLCPFYNRHPIPPEMHILKNAMPTEGLRGYIDFHDPEKRKYYRSFQGFNDFDVIRRLVPYNLCAPYPGVTVRYFAVNWPEYCILAFTDTHIPEGIIMAYPEEPLKARITMLAVKNILARRKVYRTLLKMEIKKLKEGGVKEIVLSPGNENPNNQFFEIFCNFEPFRRMNIKGE
ncbi:unnamed protein product, partial [Hymenolepis diminuta]